MHLKAAQRYPTHEYAFSLLHDCMSTAEAAELLLQIQLQSPNRAPRRAGSKPVLDHAASRMAEPRRRYAALVDQLLWAHGMESVGVQ